MSAEFKMYEPIIPVETVVLMGSEVKTWDWYPYPSKRFWNSGNVKEAVLQDNSLEVLSLGKQYGLQGYLESIDLTTGCRFPCQTCIRDSQSLSSIMSFEAANKIMQSDIFKNLIPEWSVCVGFSAEPTDNPHVLEIIKTMLESTADKEEGFKISLKTNYRKQKEDTVL